MGASSMIVLIAAALAFAICLAGIVITGLYSGVYDFIFSLF